MYFLLGSSPAYMSWWGLVLCFGMPWCMMQDDASIALQAAAALWNLGQCSVGKKILISSGPVPGAGAGTTETAMNSSWFGVRPGGVQSLMQLFFEGTAYCKEELRTPHGSQGFSGYVLSYNVLYVLMFAEPAQFKQMLCSPAAGVDGRASEYRFYREGRTRKEISKSIRIVAYKPQVWSDLAWSLLSSWLILYCAHTWHDINGSAAHYLTFTLTFTFTSTSTLSLPYLDDRLD